MASTGSPDSNPRQRTSYTPPVWSGGVVLPHPGRGSVPALVHSFGFWFSAYMCARWVQHPTHSPSFRCVSGLSHRLCKLTGFRNPWSR